MRPASWVVPTSWHGSRACSTIRARSASSSSMVPAGWARAPCCASWRVGPRRAGPSRSWSRHGTWLHSRRPSTRRSSRRWAQSGHCCCSTPGSGSRRSTRTSARSCSRACRRPPVSSSPRGAPRPRLVHRRLGEPRARAAPRAPGPSRCRGASRRPRHRRSRPAGADHGVGRRRAARPGARRDAGGVPSEAPGEAPAAVVDALCAGCSTPSPRATRRGALAVAALARVTSPLPACRGAAGLRRRARIRLAERPTERRAARRRRHAP